MLRRIFHPLHQRTPVSFVSDFPLQKSIDRLRERTKRSALFALTRQAGVGVVSENKVNLRRAVPFFHKGFQPIFIGQFTADRNRAILEGHFTLSRSTRHFMTIWLGFGILWTFLSFLLALVLAVKPGNLYTLLFPLIGVAFICLGWLNARFGQWLSRGDIAFLTNVIEQALRADPHGGANRRHG